MNCYSYPDAHIVIAYLTSTVTKNTLISGTIDIITPPYKTLVASNDPPIEIYVYTRSKLVDIWSIEF